MHIIVLFDSSYDKSEIVDLNKYINCIYREVQEINEENNMGLDYKSRRGTQYCFDSEVKISFRLTLLS